MLTRRRTAQSLTRTVRHPNPIPARARGAHKPDYLAINPNAKVPTIIDGDVTVFNSNAILLYLGEKTGKFMPPAGDKARGSCFRG